MDKLVQKIFIEEIKKQCEFYYIGLERIQEFIDASFIDMNKHKKNMRELWYSLQNILVASANISKILWPKKNKYKDRGIELRKLLSVDDNSILKPKLMRNAFEHYDEKIEDWIKTIDTSIYVDSNVGNIDEIKLSNMNKNKYMRNFDTKRMDLTFRDMKYDISKVFDAVAKLFNEIINLEKGEYY